MLAHFQKLPDVGRAAVHDDLARGPYVRPAGAQDLSQLQPYVILARRVLPLVEERLDV
ncbi:hypothetical protein [Streptomyces sp. SM11]|uniref:hypothetical protein n=1 Tax=Streptomyces sp. SM11 TaxID=565557 RepID=UPI00215621F8|nr:hypothetical protein [Streptomyces sp. SM11]